MKGDLDPVGRAGQRLVDPVVDDLPQAVHEAARVGGPDVHPRPLADRLQALEDQEVGGVVGGVDRVLLGRGNPVRVAVSNLPATRRAGTTPRLPVGTGRRGYGSKDSSAALGLTQHTSQGQ
jgi:hypothetical protein